MIACLLILLAGCAVGSLTEVGGPDDTSPTTKLSAVEIYEATVEANYVVNFMLPRDSILPIYEPEFVLAADSPLSEDELVIGVSIAGETKAYPISVLRVREMVNDDLAGIPILVSW